MTRRELVEVLLADVASSLTVDTDDPRLDDEVLVGTLASARLGIAGPLLGARRVNTYADRPVVLLTTDTGRVTAVR